jgi:hypothetical protein
MGNPGGPVWHTISPPIGLDVEVQGANDFTGEGWADILWRNTGTGNTVISRMRAGVVQQWITIGVVPTNVRIQIP